jgi:hypothetical protein
VTSAVTGGVDGVLNRLQANDRAPTVMMLKMIRIRVFIICPP